MHTSFLVKNVKLVEVEDVGVLGRILMVLDHSENLFGWRKWVEIDAISHVVFEVTIDVLAVEIETEIELFPVDQTVVVGVKVFQDTCTSFCGVVEVEEVLELDAGQSAVVILIVSFPGAVEGVRVDCNAFKGE